MRSSAPIGSPFFLSAVLLACGPEPRAAAPVASSPAPAHSVPAPPASASASAGGYSGHGLGSVSPAVLARYAPPALDPSVTTPIQSMLDLRSPPGSGIPSPDGKRLFFSWKVTGTSQVWRLDGPQRFPIQMTGGADETRVVDVTPDGNTIVVQRDRNGEINPGVYLQSATGGPLTVIQHKPDVQTFAQFVSDDGHWLYYRANDVARDSYALYRHDLQTGTRETVFHQPGIWSISDHQPDGTLLLRKETGGTSSEYYELEPAKKTLRPLFGQGESEDWSAMYGASRDEVIARAPHGGEFYRLWLWKAGTFKAISPDEKRDVELFSVDPSHKRILFDFNEDGFLTLRGLDAHTFAPITLPKLPAAETTYAVNGSRDGRFSVLRVSSSRMPYTSFVHDWKTGKLTQWTVPGTPEIDVSKFAEVKVESYPARDGVKIPMLVRRPASCAKPCPVVVAFHGGPEGQAFAGFDPDAQLFVDAGFVFVQPNVRGSTGYGKTWQHADDGPKRMSVITDIEDASKYIRSAWAANGKSPKIGIYGGSYGGYSTLIGMTMFAGAYDAGAEIVGTSNLVTFVRNTAPYRRILRASEYGDPDRDGEVMLQLSPMTYVDRLSGPLLLIQGANDPNVPVGESIQFHDALAARKVDVPLIIFPDEGHGAQKRENLVRQFGYVLAFFKKHLQPAS
ncbi:MAG: S9 family peptidase [Polyangiales bacterium]